MSRPPPVEIPISNNGESDNEKKESQPEVRGRARTSTNANRWKPQANLMKPPSSESPPSSSTPEPKPQEPEEEVDKTLKRQRSFHIAGLKNRQTENAIPKVQEILPGLQQSVVAKESSARKNAEILLRPRLKRGAEFSDINSVLKDMQEQEKSEFSQSSKDMSKILNVFQAEQDEIDNMPREEKHALYENVLRCIMLPLSAYLADSEQGQAAVEDTMSQFTLDNYRTIRHLLGVEKSDHQLIGQRVVKANEHIIFALEDNIANLHKNQVYGPSSFANKDDFDLWRDYHKKLQTKLMDRFYRERARKVSLYITVAEASDVAIKDEDTQTSDPYCVVSLKSQEKKKFLGPGSKEKYPVHKTKIIYESLDPVWLDKFQYELDDDYKNYKLSVVMWDKDQYSSDDYMGEVSVPLLSMGEFQEKFDEWKKVGKSKKYAKHKVKGDLHLITQLRIRSFVQNSPDVAIKLPIQYAELEAHKQYSKLLIKLLQKENKNYQTDIKGLSTFSAGLLEQFALYYGVSEYYQKLMYLNFLFDNWQITVGFARLVMRFFHEIVELKTNHPVPMTTKESDLFEQLKKTFRKRVKQIIVDYRESIKTENLEGALNVFLLAVGKLFGEKYKLEMTEKNLKKGTQKWYDGLYGSTKLGSELNTGKMLKLADAVLQSLNDDHTFYASEFNGFDVTSTNGQILCPKLMQDVNGVLAQDTLFTVTPDTFALYFKLKELNQFIKERILGVTCYNLNPMFEPFIQNWMDQAKTKLMDWSTQVFQLDENKEWPPILPDAPDNPILHSSSIVDIFDSVNQSFKFLTTIDFDQQAHYKAFLQNIVCALLEIYVDRIEESAKTAINSAYQFADQIHDNDELVRIASQNKEHILYFLPNKHICTRLNNLEASQNLLEDFSTYLSGYLNEDDVTDIFHPVIKKASNSLRVLMDMISYQINRDMKSAVELALEHDEEEETRCDTLFAYLNMQLETLTGGLYSGIFGKLLSKIFALLMKDLELKVLPLQLPSEHDEERPDLAAIINDMIGSICEFFSADGEGIRDGLRDKLVTLLTTVCPLFTYETKDIIKLYKKLSADQEEAKKKAEAPADRKSRRISKSLGSGKLVRSKSANFRETPTSVLHPEHAISILFTKPDDDLAMGFAEKHIKLSLQQRIQYLFDIEDPEEDVLGRYLCRNSSYQTGILYVTTNFVCFDPLTEPQRTRLWITDIAATTKDNPVQGSIHMIMKTQEEYLYFDMDSRMCLQNIMTRGKEQGVKIESVEAVQRRNHAMTLKPATWRPDEDVHKCTQCKTEFSFTVRKHHCRQCGEIFCAECSSQKAPVPALNYTMERVCDACFDSFPEKYERAQPGAFCL